MSRVLASYDCICYPLSGGGGVKWAKHHRGARVPQWPRPEPVAPGGGHSIVKLNTTCETSLLPLYNMAYITLNFMISFLHTNNIFFIYKKISHVHFLKVIVFNSILRHSC